MQHVEIIDQISPLERERWRFWFYETTFQFYMDDYARETRKSKRHRKWEIAVVEGQKQAWTRLYSARDNLPKMPVPSVEIQERARRKFVARLTYGGKFR